MNTNTLVLRFCLLPLWMLAANALAQATFVVPATVATTEGNSGGTIAGFSGRSRQQILVSQSALQQAQGKTITALWFRRDDLFGKAFLPSAARLRVEISRAAKATTAPSPLFANNRGLAPTAVFNGVVSLPANFAPPTPAPWDSTYAVQIRFDTGFAYAGGDLCVEIEGTPQNPPQGFVWWVDYQHDADVGVATPFGTSCGLPSIENARTAAATGTNMVPGGTLALIAFGFPSTPAILMIGPQLAVPQSLHRIGALGCWLYVWPLVQVPAVYPAASAGTQFGALSVDIYLPSTVNLLGGRFVVQAANLETGPQQSNGVGITTTNALDITLASRMPSGSVSTVYSEAVGPTDPFPTTGVVFVSRGPVMLFETL